MSEDGLRMDVARTAGLIGPNAILQLLPILDQIGGPERRAHMLAEAGIFEVPDGSCMIPETQAARLHRQLRRDEPEMAPVLAAHAGLGTADYILAHRIPAAAQRVLGFLPAPLAARALARAIAAHAWTFVGSGQLRVADPWTFEIRENPLIAGESGDACLCHWHAAVFARLYQTLVARDCQCHETTCGARRGDDACRFEVWRG